MVQVGLVRVCKQALTLTPGGQRHLLGWTPAILVFTLIPEPSNGLYPAPGVSSPEVHPDGTGAALLMALLSRGSPLPGLPGPPGTGFHPPPDPLMDALACETTYETLNNNNVVISHSPAPRASIESLQKVNDKIPRLSRAAI